jgi:hypothetical protein
MSGTAFAIPARTIANVTPSVISAGGTALDLVGVFVTDNIRVPSGIVLTYPTLTDVQNYFGTTDPLTLLAGTYFLGYDSSFIKPGSMWVVKYATTALGAWARGATVSTMTIGEMQALTGSFSVTIDGVAYTAPSISLAAATSFSMAGNIMATALALPPLSTASFTGAIAGNTLTITAITPVDTVEIGDNLNGASVTAGTTITAFVTGTGGNGTYTVSGVPQTVSAEAMTASQPAITFDSIIEAMVINSTSTGPASTVGYPTGTLAASLNLTQATGIVLSQGMAPSIPAGFMDTVTALTEDWASFTTTFDPDNGVGNTAKLAFAKWCNDADSNFLYVPWDSDVLASESPTASTTLGWQLKSASYSGTAPIWSPADGPNKAAFILGAVASIDFSQTNGRPTMMFRKQSGLVPDVITGFVSANLTANGYNYYGAWSTSNQTFQFLAEGSLSGAFAWIDSYINSIWLTNQFQVALMVLMTSVPSIPYNPFGYSMIYASLMDPINQGLNYGAFRTGVTLSESQKVQVNALSGAKIDQILTTQGYFLSIRDPGAQVRQARGSPLINFFYMDGGAVQHIDMSSILVM